MTDVARRSADRSFNRRRRRIERRADHLGLRGRACRAYVRAMMARYLPAVMIHGDDR